MVDFAKELVPTAKINYSGKVINDPRNYRVNFDLLYSLLPDFYLTFDVRQGMSKLLQEFKEKKFCIKDFVDNRYVRLRRLSEILSKKDRGGLLE